MTDLIPWKAVDRAIVPKTASLETMVSFADRLSDREKSQVVSAMNAGSFEMAVTFVWARSLAVLKKQISSLGMDFIGQMLGRPEIQPNAMIDHAVTDFELISLCEDLGVFTPTEALRIRQTHELVSHFAQLGGSETEELTPEEAIRCLRTSVDSILGQNQAELPGEFISFRKRLETETFDSDSPEVQRLANSPLFFQRTTVSILLSQLESARGATREHAIRNTESVIPAMWSGLPEPIRWNVGSAYARFKSEGTPRSSEAKALGRALLAVHGFDFVPETLRSSTYVAAAHEVMKVHEAYDNFHNEPPTVEYLASLGSSIPMPAFPAVMSALICVSIGNGYGVSFQAKKSADKILFSLTERFWSYYLKSCLPTDKSVLFKLCYPGKPQKQWCALLQQNTESIDLKAAGISRTLVEASLSDSFSMLTSEAARLYGAK